MFNPAIHTATNKPVGLIGKPVDARTYFYDEVNFVYRAYVSTAEVLAYLNTASDRVGQFAIIINTGGSLSAGVITGGTNAEWWFKNGVADANLILKNNSTGAVATDIAVTAGESNPKPILLSDHPAFDKNASFQYWVANVGFVDFTVTRTFSGSTFTGWTFFGHDDGTGHFLEDATITLKP